MRCSQKLMTILGLGFVALTSLTAQAAEIDACRVEIPSLNKVEQVLFKIEGDTLGSMNDKILDIETPKGVMNVRFTMLGAFNGDGSIITKAPRHVAVVVKGPEKDSDQKLELKSITGFGMPSGGTMTVYAGGKSVHIECKNFK